jgi:ribosomal protein L21E
MVKRLDGARKRSRHKMRKTLRRKGKTSLTAYFQEFKPGEMATLKAEPAYHKGLYPLKLHGKTGIIRNRVGRCYEVIVDDGKQKTLLVHPAHLKRM